MTIKLCGDLHGIPSNAKFVVDQWPDATEEDYLIVCGDFGAEYGNFTSSSFKKVFKKFPGTVLVLRGNHDARYWDNHTVLSETPTSYIVRPNDGWELCNIRGSQENQGWPGDLLYQKKYPNIKYIQDYGDMFKIEDKTFLFIPGAYSVDKYYRLQNNLPYEPREQLSYGECLSILSWIELQQRYNLPIDYVVSHTCPLMLQPHIKDLFLGVVDQTTIDNSTEIFLDNVLETLGADGFKHWYFGHYHDERDIMGKFHMLYTNIQELGE